MNNGILVGHAEAVDTDEHEMPCYSERGRAIVEILTRDDNPYGWRWEFDLLDSDGGACFWINEGAGWAYWLDHMEFPGPGVYALTNIHGEYTRGEWGYTEDEEDFFFDDPVPTGRRDLDPSTLGWENLIRRNNPIVAPPAHNPACFAHADEIFYNLNPLRRP